MIIDLIIIVETKLPVFGNPYDIDTPTTVILQDSYEEIYRQKWRLAKFSYTQHSQSRITSGRNFITWNRCNKMDLLWSIVCVLNFIFYIIIFYTWYCRWDMSFVFIIRKICCTRCRWMRRWQTCTHRLHVFYVLRLLYLTIRHTTIDFAIFATDLKVSNDEERRLGDFP